MSLSWLRSLVVFLGVFSLFASPSLTLADPSGLAADIENARASLKLEGSSAPDITKVGAQRIATWRAAAEKGASSGGKGGA